MYSWFIYYLVFRSGAFTNRTSFLKGEFVVYFIEVDLVALPPTFLYNFHISILYHRQKYKHMHVHGEKKSTFLQLNIFVNTCLF